MNRCDDIQREFEAFLSGDIEDAKKGEIQSHLNECQDCSRALKQAARLSAVLKTWKGIEPTPLMYEKLKGRVKAHESSWGRIFTYSFMRKTAFRMVEVAVVVVLTLLISHLLRKPYPEAHNDSTTINFYLNEHQGVTTQVISTELLSQPATRMYEGQDDFMYFEFIENHPNLSKPGILLKGPKIRREIRLPKASALSKGDILSLSQVRDVIDFNPIMPQEIDSSYFLVSIRKIDDYNCLHLLYSKGIETLSLFELPSDSKRGLSVRDSREYIAYSDKDSTAEFREEGKQTLLAWSDGDLSFVLTGKTNISGLLEIAQSLQSTEGKIMDGVDDSSLGDYPSGIDQDYESVKTTKKKNKIKSRGEMISREKKTAKVGV